MLTMGGGCFGLSFILMGATQSSASSLRFTTFEPSDTPGVVCPGAGAACTNGAAEPAIRAAHDGTFYASSEAGLGAGTEAWKSMDGGRHYTALPSPNAQSGGGGITPAGGDTDLAVAPALNAAHIHNVYVASLNGANVVVSTSQDGGSTWSVNPTGASIPGDDREWIAADGIAKVCISYHDLATSSLNVNCSANAGVTFTQLGKAVDATHTWVVGNNDIGTLAIDPSDHTVYQAFDAIAGPTEVPCAGAGTCAFHAVWIAVSVDGGQTFNDYPVYVNPDSTVGYGHSFVQVSVDRGSNVYAVYSDDHDVFYSFSTDHGHTWSAPVAVNRGFAKTAIFPWSVAGDAGKLDIVWYGSAYHDGGNPPDNYPVSASWRVFFAQNLSATTPGTVFRRLHVTPVIHKGGVCETGITCTGNRDLFDDFGVSASPTTGFASIVYSDDRYSKTPSSPPPPGCTRQTTNSSACVHTSIATQVSGSGIFSLP